MSKPAQPNNRPITITLTPEIWEFVDAEKMRRPYDSIAEIIREYLLVADQVIKAERNKTNATIAEIEAIKA